MSDQEKRIQEIASIFRHCARIASGCSHAYIAPETLIEAAGLIESQEQTISALTARAEQAEANMPWVRIDGWDYFCQVKMFDPKANQITVNDKKYGWHTVGYEKVKEWRGLPQEGDGEE